MSKLSFKFHHIIRSRARSTYVLISYFGGLRSLPYTLFLYVPQHSMTRTDSSKVLDLPTSGVKVLCFSTSITVVAAWAAVACSQKGTSSVVLGQVRPLAQGQIQRAEVELRPACPSSEFRQAVAEEACHP